MTERLKVIEGPAFSGKTKALNEVLKEALNTNQFIISVQPPPEENYPKRNCCTYTHDGDYVPCLTVGSAQEILDLVMKTEEDKTPPKKIVKIVIIDNVHLFSPDIIRIINILLSKNIKVIVAGTRREITTDRVNFQDILSAASEIDTLPQKEKKILYED